MTTQECYQEILETYPEYITKDQMYRICHISKRTCLFLLESGIVPNIDTGKKTRRFKIKTLDVVAFLQQRELAPSSYRVPTGYYAHQKKDSKNSFSTVDIPRIRLFYKELLLEYPDVLTTMEVATFTGYNKNTIAKWCSKKLLKSFFIHPSFKIPKEYLLNFLTSEYFFSIADKSQIHKKLDMQIWQLISNHI